MWLKQADLQFNPRELATEPGKELHLTTCYHFRQPEAQK